ALLAKHCFASARTPSRRRLGRTPEGGLRRPPQPDPPCHPSENPLLLLLLRLRLPASGRHYHRCRVQPGRTTGAGCNPADTHPVLRCGHRQPRRRDGGDRVVAAVRG
ncbi:hypothetical protein C9412_00005, partial [Stenotrophomonas sp. Nf1]